MQWRNGIEMKNGELMANEIWLALMARKYVSMKVSMEEIISYK